LQVDADKLGLSLGASLEVGGGVAVDLSYTHLFYGQTTVTDSIVRQTNATDPENTTTVGNGRYTISAQAIGLGLRYDLR
jgi:long-subunit fatty acid transport protein